MTLYLVKSDMVREAWIRTEFAVCHIFCNSLQNYFEVKGSSA
jgi:hypothetical protein